MKMLAILTAAAAISAAGQAGAGMLDCAIKTSAAGRGVISDRYFFEVDQVSGRARAVDDMIIHFNATPVSAGPVESSAGKTVFGWSVKVVDSAGQHTNMQFRAAYFAADSTVIVRAVPGGEFSGHYEGRGTCR